jgi:hypothetical protein
MPIPFLLIGIGAATAALGIGKGIKAAVDNSDANDLNDRANGILEQAKASLEDAGRKSGKGLMALGEKKVFILDKSINRFVFAYEKLKNVELQESVGLDELKNFKLDKQSFDSLKEMGGYASTIAGGAVSGALGGALTAFGAYGAAGMFATASTGTAIATLSGAAATNATLAFFGGGALAAGGLGMAGGALVLGGLVAGPALAIMGFIIGGKASANLDKAYSNIAEARKIAEELKLSVLACNAIRRRSALFERLLIRLDSLFIPHVLQLEKIIKEKGVDYSVFDKDEKQTVAAVTSLAVAIKAVLDTPILTKDGKLTKESNKFALEAGKPSIVVYGNSSDIKKIHQLLPHAECDDCKDSSRMACARKIESGGVDNLDFCPYISEEAKKAIGSMKINEENETVPVR